MNVSGTSRHRTSIRASPSAEIYLVTQSPDAAHTAGIRYTPTSDGAARRIIGAAAIIDGSSTPCSVSVLSTADAAHPTTKAKKTTISALRRGSRFCPFGIVRHEICKS